MSTLTSRRAAKPAVLLNSEDYDVRYGRRSDDIALTPGDKGYGLKRVLQGEGHMNTIAIEEFGIEELETRTETTWYFYYCTDLVYSSFDGWTHWAYSTCWYYWA